MTIGEYVYKTYNPFSEEQTVFLNSVTVPDNATIAMAQIQAANDLYPSSPELERFVENANIDLHTVFETTMSDSAAVNEVIESIETALGVWSPTGPLTGSAGILRTTISDEYDETGELQLDLVKYENLYNNLLTMYQNLSSISDSFIKEKLAIVEAGMLELEHDIANYKNGTFIPKAHSKGGYINKAIGLGYALKGRYLEVAATTWLAEHIPENIKIVDTGRVYGVTFDLFGQKKSSGKQLKSDILAFDTALTDGITIEYSLNGKKQPSVTLSKFLEIIESNSGTETISLDEHNYNELSKAVVFGAQAKSGYNQAIFNKGTATTTVNDIVSKNLAEEFGKALHLIIQAAADDKDNIYNKQPMYNAMFNFLLSKHLNYIIGRENNLIVTRSGIWTLADYMDHQWRTAQRLIQAYALVGVHSKDADKKVILEYSKEKIFPVRKK